MTLAVTYLSQAVVQAGVTHFETSNNWFFEQVNKVQTIVYGLNLGAIFVGYLELDLFSILHLYGVSGELAGWIHGAVYFGWALTATVIVAIINHYLTPQVDLVPNIQGLSAEERAQTHVSWDNSSYQVWMQSLHLTQIVTSVALVFFSANPAYYAASAVLQLFSFMRTCEWKWIRIDRTFVVRDMNDPLQQNQEGPISFAFSYYFAALPAPRGEMCAICVDQAATAHWHGQHIFCHPCTIQHIAVHSGNIHNHLHAGNVRRHHRVERTRFGNIWSEQVNHSIQLPAGAIPNCPLCREHPPQNDIKIWVLDRFQSERYRMLQDSYVEATVTIRPEPAAQPAG